MDLIGYNKRVQKDKVTGFEKFAYGCGEISTNIVFTIATSLLTMFYTDVAHVSAATIGMIIAISQIFNGASDICAGFIVDRTRSKYGRARVWMLRMSGPYAIAAILLMTVPQIAPMAQAIYVYIIIYAYFKNDAKWWNGFTEKLGNPYSNLCNWCCTDDAILLCKC